VKWRQLRRLAELEAGAGNELTIWMPDGSMRRLTVAEVDAALKVVLAGGSSPDAEIVSRSVRDDGARRGAAHRVELLRVLASTQLNAVPVGESPYDACEPPLFLN
jgi:hypothetical protein